MIDIETPQSPGWWVSRLAKRLERERPELQALMDRVEGNGPIPQGATTEATKAYEAFRKNARLNFAGKLVRSRTNRVKLVGIRTAATNDINGDAEAAAMLTRSRMKTALVDMSTRTVALGRCPIMVESIDGLAYILVEDPRQVVIESHPIIPGRALAALKMYHDDVAAEDVCVLHLPGLMHRATRQRKSPTGAPHFSPSEFNWSGDPVPTGLDLIPATEAVLDGGRGLLRPHLDLVDQMDQAAFERRVISIVQAWRQRMLMIPDGKDKDAQGGPIRWEDIWTLDPASLGVLPEGSELWESQIANLQPQISQEQHQIRLFADLTSTPMRSFHTDAAGGSAEGAASQREDLVCSVEDVGDALEDAICDATAIGFLLQGDTQRSDRSKLAAMWADPARRSLAERADAWTKTSDLPEDMRLRDVWGLEPAQVAEVRAEMVARQLAAAAATQVASGNAA